MMLKLLSSLVLLLIASVSAAGTGTNFLPSDTATVGASSNIPFSVTGFGANQSGWPSTGDCLKTTTTGGYASCDANGELSPFTVHPYIGQVYVRNLVCSAEFDHEGWDDAASYIDIAVYEVEGLDGTTGPLARAFARNQVGSAQLHYTNTSPVGVSQVATINAPTTIANGKLQVAIKDQSVGTTINTDNGFVCVINGYD